MMILDGGTSRALSLQKFNMLCLEQDLLLQAKYNFMGLSSMEPHPSIVP